MGQCDVAAGMAMQLAQQSAQTFAGCMQDLVDTHILRDAREVVTALQQHNCGPALQWCQQQAPRLKKIKSKLEFKLRIQVSHSLLQGAHSQSAGSTVPIQD